MLNFSPFLGNQTGAKFRAKSGHDQKLNSWPINWLPAIPHRMNVVGKSVISFVEKHLFLYSEWEVAEGFTEKVGTFSGKKIWNRRGKFWEKNLKGPWRRLVSWNFHGSDVTLEHMAQKQMGWPLLCASTCSSPTSLISNDILISFIFNKINLSNG